MNRVLICGTASGSGKTTVTCSLLAALIERGYRIASCKCGPDYIDPMFHRQITGIKTGNLDPYFCTELQLRQLLSIYADADLTVIEGVMGYYDGIGCTEWGSTYQVAKAVKAPVILVVSPKGMSNSVGALIQGFKNYRQDSGIQGIIFNGISAVMYQFLIPVVEQAGLKPLGFLPYQPELSVASRHLGLVTAAEIIDIRQKMTELGRLAEQCLDLEGILALAATAPPLREQPLCYPQVAKIRIAVARDKAFCFIYRENIELLEAMGAELVYFSPLVDSSLPEQIDGLYLCGGYPELYQEQLSANQNLRQQIAEKIANGLPTIAECGGFMYLHQWLGDWPMVGTIAGKAYPTPKLQRFGYLNITAKKDNLVALAGESIRAHEFHYWESENCGDSFGGEKAGGKSSYSCIHATPTLYAGFPHLYFPANPKFAENFIKKTKEYAAIHNV